MRISHRQKDYLFLLRKMHSRIVSKEFEYTIIELTENGTIERWVKSGIKINKI